jgi:hypothetical protein
MFIPDESGQIEFRRQLWLKHDRLKPRTISEHGWGLGT